MMKFKLYIIYNLDNIIYRFYNIKINNIYLQKLVLFYKNVNIVYFVNKCYTRIYIK